MVKRSRIPGVLLKFLKGRHIDMDFVEVFKADKAEIVCESNSIVNIDGELLDGLPFNARVVKGGLKVYAPRSKAYL